MDDGQVLRADVYRPDADDPAPVIMTHGPYGKGVRYQEHYKPMWEWLIGKHPGLLPGSTRSYLTWETVDPEVWVPWAMRLFALIREELGVRQDISTFSPPGRRAITIMRSNGRVLRLGRTAKSG